ncbi:MAG: hypothetical protein J6D27_05005, partial [Ruminiclostridium sp.]|nr:hypothetical protein [Ruminiclostridium sp.]
CIGNTLWFPDLYQPLKDFVTKNMDIISGKDISMTILSVMMRIIKCIYNIFMIILLNGVVTNYIWNYNPKDTL